MIKTDKNDYPPIENHAIIGDLKTAALVELNGSINFFCFPNFDSPSVFTQLLDVNKGGFFKIHPTSNDVRYKQFYHSSTNVLLTRFLTPNGIGEVTDFMVVGTPEGTNVLVRKINSIYGDLTFELECAPAFQYAEQEHNIKQLSNTEVRFVEQGGENASMRLICSEHLKIKNKSVVSTFEVKQGEVAYIILECGHNNIIDRDHLSELAEQMYNDTVDYWQNWLKKCTYTGDYKSMVFRSALVLKLLISNQYGAMVAAPTFSLPEEPGGYLNWDYRYSWIRDVSFSIYTLLSLGFDEEANHYFKWIEKISAKAQKEEKPLNIMYTISGEENLQERFLKQLEGYNKAQPVRVGNAAYEQMQMDVYGELLNAIHLYDKYCESITYALWEDIQRILNWLVQHWQDKGHGIWEERGERQSFLVSRLMEWVALDRGIKIATHNSFPMPNDWIEIRDKLFNKILNNFWNEELQSFVKEENTACVDGAILLMPIMNFISGRDDKWRSTMKKIEADLATDTLVFRRMYQEEGFFVACSFWYIECLTRQEEFEKAHEYFEKMLGYSNHVGLYAEEIGHQGEHLGNFPQALSHLALINCALYLDKVHIKNKLS